MGGNQMQQGSAAQTGYTVGVFAASMVANYYCPGSGILVQMAGTMLGTVLFPPETQKVRGPRVEDLNVTSSTYGKRIPFVYGSMRVNTNIIWSSGLIESVATNTTGGKGMGGASVRTQVFTYTCHMAQALCEGEITDVLRIWMDQKLVFDKTGSTEEITAINNLEFTVYNGNETQLPDPIMEGYLGVGNVPAHRGLAYIVFRNLELTKFGNRIPAMSVEVTKAPVTQATPLVSYTLPYGTAPGSFTIDWAGGMGCIAWYSGSDPNDNGLVTFDLTTLTPSALESSATLNLNGTPAGVHASATSDFIYAAYASGLSADKWVQLQKHNLGSVTSFGPTDIPANPITPVATGFRDFPRTGWEVAVIGETLIELHAVFQGINGDLVIMGSAGSCSMDYLWSRDNDYSASDGGGCGITGPVSAAIGSNVFYAVAYDGISTLGPNIYIDVVKIDAGAFWIPPFGAVDGATIGVGHDVHTIDVRSIDPDTSKLYCKSVSQPAYDMTDGGIIIQCSTVSGGGDGSPNNRLFKWRDGGVVWAVDLGSTPTSVGAALNQSRLRRNIYVNAVRDDFLGQTYFNKHDTRTGTYLGYETGPGWDDAHVSDGQSYDSDTNSVVADGSPGLMRLYGGHVLPGAGTALSTIVTDLCGRAGIDNSEIDVSQLTDTVKGYLVDGQTTVRAALEPLSGTFHWDPVESDGVLKFVKRGTAAVATIYERDLGVGQQNDFGAVIETRSQDIELPERVSLNYIDYARDYQVGLATAKRAREPLPTAFARGESNLNVPVVLTPDQAKGVAQVLLRNAWIERSTVGFTLPWNYMTLDPTDSVNIVLTNGATYRTRITKMEIAQNFSITVESVTNQGTRYLETPNADGGLGFQQSRIQSNNPSTKTFILDIPLLRSTDDPGSAGTTLYYALAGTGQSGWVGAEIFRSLTGATYGSAVWGLSSVEAPWGTIVGALATPRDPWVTDTDTVLTVAMAAGGDELASITHAQMLEGMNAAVVLNSTGEPEIIQFQTVTLVGTNYELTNLLRGRRGTEVYIGNHPTGSRFVMLSTAWVGKTIVTTGDIGVARFYKGVGYGGNIEDVSPVGMTTTARDLKPYAVCNITSTGNPGDLTIAWVRRTRLNGELMDGTGAVPLGEATEAYEVDVRAVGSPTVLRTISAASATAPYTAAQQTTDFGTIPAFAEIDIFQLSAVVGRGFKATSTIALL